MALEIPTTKLQRRCFDAMSATDRAWLSARANALYDGTRTVSECWKIAFTERMAPSAVVVREEQA